MISAMGVYVITDDIVRHQDIPLKEQYNKNLTLLKIDDVSNTGSIKLRVRSLVESLHISLQQAEERQVQKPLSLPLFTKKDRKKKIIMICLFVQ